MGCMLIKALTGPIGPQAHALDAKAIPTVLKIDPTNPRIRYRKFKPFCWISVTRKNDSMNPTNPNAPYVS